MQWTPHPALPVPSESEMMTMGSERLLAYFNKREEAISNEKSDPYRYGFELEPWARADEQLRKHQEILVMGGNRAGKSEWAAKRVVESLTRNPGTIIWCLTETSANSIQFQQKMIFKYLAKEHKSLGRGKVGYVMYSLRNGFTASKFSLPNGSECVFRHWSQDISTIEGGEIGCPGEPAGGSHNVGFWADELIPLSWLETIRYRCVTRNAKGLVTFTAVDGWNSVVKSLLTGARTEEEIEADLLPGEKVPLVQQPLRKASTVVYFHTAENPFGGWSNMKAQLEGEKRDVILCRAYGVPVKSSRTVFPNLTDDNVAKHSEIPILKNPDDNPATWVLSIDPAGAKPWTMVLFGIDAHQVAWAVAEFPDFDGFGPWMDLSKERGRPGEAAQPNGYGIEDYALEIRRMEDGRENVERIIDPRLGAASYQKAEGSSNIISDLSDAGVPAYAAEALDVETGVQAINNLLSWNREEKMSLENKPRLMISDACQNLRACMQEYQPSEGAKAISKDFVDCVRYFAVGNYEYYEEAELVASGTGGY